MCVFLGALVCFTLRAKLPAAHHALTRSTGNTMADGVRQMYEYGIATPPHCRDREETGVIRPGARAHIVGLSSRQELNGTPAVIGVYDTDKGRWAVQTEGGERIRVKASNIRVDSRQPDSVPAAADWLRDNVPPGLKFAPKMPPIHMPGMPPPLSAEEEQLATRETATLMAAYALARAGATGAAQSSLACQCAALPQEPDAPWDPDASGWVVGYTEPWVWVLAQFEDHGDESNRYVLLGRTRTDGPPAAKDVKEALMQTMLAPRFDTSSSAGPRRPRKVKLQRSLVSVSVGVKKDLKKMGVKVEVEDAFMDEMDEDWFGSWYRCEVGLPVTDEMWLSIVEPSRRHPMQPKEQRGPQSAVQRAAAQAYATHPVPTVEEVRGLPIAQVQWCLAADPDAGILYIFEPPSSSAPELVLQAPVELHGPNRQPTTQCTLGVLRQAMKEQGCQPDRLCIGQPSIASMMNIREYEDALQADGVQADVMLAAPRNLEEMVAMAYRLPTLQAAAFSTAPLWVGGRVTLTGLAARPELNGRQGVVDGRAPNAERWAVQLVTPDGLRDGSTIALKAANLLAASPPPATARNGTCLELSPAALESARDGIPVQVAPEALPVSGGGNLEMQEKAILQASRGWTAVRGLKAYTKRATYPDLYVYFDADSTSAVNHFAMRAFTAYPEAIGGLPPDGIRGDVVVIRAKSLSSIRMSSGSAGGVAASTTHTPAGGGYAPMIGIEELRDTLLFYVTNEARAIARERDLARTLGGMPSEMAAMMGGSMPTDLGTFTMP